MYIEEKFVKIEKALKTMEDDYINNIDDSLYLDKIYGSKFQNIFNEKKLYVSGLNSILKDKFNLDITDEDLKICLYSIQSTDHMKIEKGYVNKNNPKDIFYLISFK